MTMDYEIVRYETPIHQDLIRDLLTIWEKVFEVDFSWLAGVLQGDESSANRNVLWIAKAGGLVAATCRLTQSLSCPRLGCLGEVATLPEYRGRRLAHQLCARAIEDFEKQGGRNLFLGTVNPVAAKVYSSLGWRYLAGTRVMSRVAAGTPEDFLADYFREGAHLPVDIVPGGPEFRVPIIPLIVTPHDFFLLDINTSLFSSRYVTQNSCEGLYQRYQSLREPARWFVLTRSDGVAVGLASCKPAEDGNVWVEAFTHFHYQEKWLPRLYRTVVEWAAKQAWGPAMTTCFNQDPFKRAILVTMGLRETQKILHLPELEGPTKVFSF